MLKPQLVTAFLVAVLISLCLLYPGLYDSFYKRISSLYKLKADTKKLLLSDDQTRYRQYLQSQLVRRIEILRQPNQTYQTYHSYMIPQIECPTAVRLGDKWLCNPWRVPRTCSVYSLGIFGDTSFETELYKISDGRCQFTCIDADRKNLTLFKPFQGRFLRRRLSNLTNAKTNEVTLHDLINQQDFGTVLDILKVDLESTGFDVLSSFFDQAESPKPCQLLVQMHAHGENITRWSRTFRLLEHSGYLLFRKEANARCYPCTDFAYIYEMCLEAYGLHPSAVIAKYFS